MRNRMRNQLTATTNWAAMKATFKPSLSGPIVGLAIVNTVLTSVNKLNDYVSKYSHFPF